MAKYPTLAALAAALTLQIHAADAPAASGPAAVTPPASITAPANGTPPAPATAQVAVTAPVAATPPVAAKGDKVLMAYYPNWAHYSGYTAEHIPYEYLTHILYAFYVTDPSGGLTNSDPPDEGNFQDLVKRAHAQGVKVLLSIGGAGQSDAFKPMAASPSARANFLKNCLKVADKFDLDGIDLDWEYPLEGDSLNQEKLHQELRAAFDKRPKRLLLTAAVPVVDYWAHWSTNKAFEYLDYLNAMTYDYMGTWEKTVLPNSGMDMSRNSMTYWESRGVPKSKLVIGAAFYGKSFDGGTGLGSTFDGKGSGNDGIWIWKDLLKQFETVPYKIHWDEKTQSEYALGNDEIIVFNGIPSQRVRGEFIKDSEYAGVMFWELLCDVPDRKKSLLVALYRGLKGTNRSAMVVPPAKP
jgi:chitinase